VPAQLEMLIMRTMAKDPEQRPQSMEALEGELQNVATLLFSNFSSLPLVEPDPVPPPGVLAALPGVKVASGVFDRVRKLDRRTKAVVAAGAVVGFALAFVWVGRASHADGRAQPAIAPVAVAVAPPPQVAAPTALPAATSAPAATKPAVEPDSEEDTADTAAVDDGKETDTKLEGDTETPGKTKTPVRVASASAAASAGGAESKKLLAEGERMLRAERFAEARAIFEKLTKSKRERGQALVGLAEIAFQEKKYADAARTAEMAADRGGGVKARVLLGDAHFRLARYKEAAKAYEDALKIDPANASAKSGLALANKRM
jgi:tetratricopeptide (TPR) repeat protein